MKLVKTTNIWRSVFALAIMLCASMSYSQDLAQAKALCGNVTAANKAMANRRVMILMRSVARRWLLEVPIKRCRNSQKLLEKPLPQKRIRTHTGSKLPTLLRPLPLWVLAGKSSAMDLKALWL